MAERLTRVRQQTEIGEGLAVGCLVAGVAATTSDEGTLDHAFSTALRAWPWATRYPAATSGRAPFVGPTLRASATRRYSHIARWTLSQGLFVPQLRDDEWDLAAACDRIEESTAVPARRWAELATAFVDGLGEGVWRYPPSDLDHDPQHLGLR